MSAQTADGFVRRLTRHFGELLRLALPVIVSRVGIIVMGSVDAIIVGHFSAAELGNLGLGHTPANVLIGTTVGLLMGAVALTSHALGAGEFTRCGEVFRNAVPYALAIGAGSALACQFGQPFFTAMGQPGELIEGATPVLSILGLGFPGMAVGVAASSFLEGLKRPIPGLIATLIGNVVNALVCWILVWGEAGLPPLGAVGSAWATTLVRTATGLGLFAYVWWLPDHARWGIRGAFKGWWQRGGDLRRFGYAAGASFTVEHAAFSALALIAGAVSPMAVAAYTVFLNLLALPFMVAAGIAAATAVRVGIGYGMRDRAEMAFAGWTGLALSVALLAPAGLLYAGLPYGVSSVYTDDVRLIATVAPMVAFSAWVLVVDGAQIVLSNALRGRNDRWVPTALQFLSYAVVMVPLSAVLVFTLDRGLMGIVEAILIASVLSAAVLAVRFAVLCDPAKV